MVARVHASVTVGVDARIVIVEADVTSGLPGMTIVGLADTAMSESRDRVRAAIGHSGVDWPRTRITVALLPASLPKRGSALDAAIAIAILAASGQVPEKSVSSTLILGELGLDGRIHPVPGVIVAAQSAVSEGFTRLLVPVSNVGEARLVPGLVVGGARDLMHLVGILRDGLQPAEPAPPEPGRADAPIPDLAEVRGQGPARYALEVAAAGGHHLAFVGVPGVGKTLLAERLPGLLPDLDDVQALEVTSIHSLSQRLPAGDRLVRRPPFESPHHTASAAAVIGGGQAGRIRLGAATLAHRGVLFLDEAPEFARPVIDALRQPLESGVIHLARADATVVLPSRFHLVIAANPCPCGRAVGDGRDCSCSPQQRRRYSARLSGPILDRIDLRLVLERPGLADLGQASESSGPVAARVGAARARARSRWADTPWRANADVPGHVLRDSWAPDEPGCRILESSLASGALSLRGADRVLRVAWTLADLSARARPSRDDIGRALALRGSDTPWAA